MKTHKKILIHFDTNETKVYELKDGSIGLLHEEQIYFNETLVHDEMFKKFDRFFEKLVDIVGEISNKTVRLYATGIFEELSKEEQMQLIIHVFVNSNLYLNILDKELERFYMEKSKKIDGSENIINGIINQEFRKVVICGSFQQNMKEISELIDKFNEHGIEVLSPWTKNVVPETLGTDFILLEGQELTNDRDAWRHKYDHMNKFKKADAIIVCNPNGIVGKGTMFEFGFMIAHYKRIIFTEEPTNISIVFPYEVGINF